MTKPLFNQRTPKTKSNGFLTTKLKEKHEQNKNSLPNVSEMHYLITFWWKKNDHVLIICCVGCP